MYATKYPTLELFAWRRFPEIDVRGDCATVAAGKMGLRSSALVASRGWPDYHRRVKGSHFSRVSLMEAKLIVVGGKATKESISLKLPAIIGRSREAGVKVGHPMISRRHAELFEADGLLMIRDLGSLNGTMIDGQRIQEAPLPPAAEFTIGPLTFRAEYTYQGDLDSLPSTVLAPPPTHDATITQPWTESPDFEAVDEAPVGKAEAKEKPRPKSTGDPFDDLLNELQ